MQALRFNEFGDPAVLHVTDMPDPPATGSQAMRASAIAVTYNYKSTELCIGSIQL